jgi:RNA polymerase sigma-70 factor (ECF subfamily)
MQAGDQSAREELLRCVGDRLERLTRKMLRDFPRVRSFSETGDVLQNAVLRLLRSLGEVKPASTRAFFALAAEQIRRELLDLARYFKGAPDKPVGESDDSQSAFEPSDHGDAGDLDRWCAFHEQVEQLPAEEREVVGLMFYHDWTQGQVAELFGVSERTVRRWWVSAQMKLHHNLRDAE